MRDGIWVEVDGDVEFLQYEEIDPEILPQLYQPVGGFCFPAGQFLRMPLPSTPFLIDGWLPRQGKMEIYGQAKAGKSTLSLQIADAVGSGKDFLGRKTEKGKVLVLQFEMGIEVLQKRMLATGRRYENVFVGTRFDLKLDVTQGKELVEQAISAVEPDLVIIDPLYKCFQGDENDTKDMRSILDFLDIMIGRYKCSTLIMHHMGKDLTKGGRGAVVLEDWCDSVVELRVADRGNASGQTGKIIPKLLRHAGGDAYEPVSIRMEGLEFVSTNAPRTADFKILEYAREHGKFSIQTFLDGEEKIGSRSTVYDAIARLITMGSIKKISRGEYEWVG